MEITPLKLQNIIYIVYGYYLIITKKRLFDEPILAWDLGPVVPSIYYFYKGKNRIKNKEYIFINEKYDKEYRIFPKYCDLNYVIFPYPVESELYNEETDLYFCSVVNMVYKFYKWKSNKELVEILHQKGSPWYKVYNRNNILASGKNRPLLDEDICKQLEPLLIKNLEHKDRNFFDIVFSMVKKAFTNILLIFYPIFTIN